jgi:drug/metabolite transporter (DMT)-like permease
LAASTPFNQSIINLFLFFLDREQWLAMLLNGLVGTVLSELLWLFGCFYTSSLVATLAISLTIPLTMIADVLVKAARVRVCPICKKNS